MAEEQYDDYGNPVEDGDNREQQWVKDLRQKAKNADRLEKKVEQYEQRDRLREAGLNLKPWQERALMNEHQGEKTAEGYRKTALDLGFVEPGPEVNPEVQQGHEQVARASQGSTGSANAEQQDDTDYSQFKTPGELMAHIAKQDPNRIQF